ncbi:hypothetical protein RFI36_21170 [Acinetobacter gerneri]|uniref:Uncharacterized protein n=1 Tax=Acinetobacter gerneri TaxID=202952 RepID=A0AAW8JPS4_9GAMM|nr:hypothetical protein [Acinetobacter gerneri]MDQ9012206.1 hypothetical protein [Acinetobacter gerneri]MDQ9016309.1 hypothetical protein [Acinetobacter gerneri]MDQ9027481.1 hypothetical protein [Acinetobacter gerneri]MDQ9054780.1 hypothetical protein [Acinetobacter gerneri]MDQ9062430.1 hypothetical protein [Acinetobacter gerneri]
MENYIINSPDDFQEFDWEYEAKGCLEANITIFDNSYTFNFYDVRRIYNVTEANFGGGSCFYDKNLVLLSSVNLNNIKVFLNRIIEKNELTNFIKN